MFHLLRKLDYGLLLTRCSTIHGGTFADYCVVPTQQVFPVPELKAECVSLILGGGMIASISVERVGKKMKNGSTVLVTAAGGATGQHAIQLAKLADCHVIGTCSIVRTRQTSYEALFCDRSIHYKKEDFKDVLRKEYPNGADIVYEVSGGEMFNTCVKNLGVGRRLIAIGFILSY